jgi:hypothetical protein
MFSQLPSNGWWQNRAERNMTLPGKYAPNLHQAFSMCTNRACPMSSACVLLEISHQQTSLWHAQYALIADSVIGMGDRRMLIASLSQAWSTS